MLFSVRQFSLTFFLNKLNPKFYEYFLSRVLARDKKYAFKNLGENHD